MNFLAVDTSSNHLSVLVRKEGKIYNIYKPDASFAHSVELMPSIDAALRHNNISLKDLDCFGVCIGAGSFTGIRIGVSTIKGLCDTLKKPAFTVTAFETIAYNIKTDKKVLAVIDARHAHYYAAGFYCGEQVLEPKFISFDELKELSKQYLLTSSTDIAPFDVKLANVWEGFISACEKNCKNHINSDEIVPLYIRKSQAEENR